MLLRQTMQKYADCKGLRRSVAERSYPSPYVRGGGWECQAVRAQEWLRGAIPRPRSEATARRGYPTPQVRGNSWEDQPNIQGVVAAWAQRAEKSYSTFKVREAAMRRYPSYKVRSSSCALLEQPWRDTPRWRQGNPSKMVGVVRGIRGKIHWNHNHRKLVNLITQTTALSNSIKLSHAMWGYPRWAGHGGEIWQNVVHWRREWQTTSLFLPWEPHEQYEKAKL